MMRIDSLLRREWTLRALALAAILGSAACNEYDGTERWPGVYPPEQEIERPKGGTMDAGRKDAGGEAGSGDGATPPADAAATLDASAGDAALDAQPGGDAALVSDGAAEAAAPSDAAPEGG